MCRTLPVVLRVAAVLCTFTILVAPGPLAHAAAAATERTSSAADGAAKQILDTAGVQGGLIVHLGCGDGRLTAALRASDRYLVHGLEADAALVSAARKHLQSLGLYGKVSVEQCKGNRLPYADNLVNLLVAEQLHGITVDEVRRVLAPLGVALIREGSQWQKTVKPRPADTDEWSHFLHDASGNAVAKDRAVGPPKRLQWEAEPRWCRSHEFPSSVNAVVTAQGRLFAILDEAPIGVYEKLPQRCSVVARDAANGLLLWKQPMRQWSYEYGTGLGDRWHIHHTLPRRLVADGDRVYVTLAFQDSPVSVLDAATGAILTEAFEGTKGTDEMLCDSGVLVVKISDESPGATQWIARKDLHGALAAVDTQRGKLLWRKEDTPVAPYAMALQDNRLVYHNLAEIVCLEAKTGRQLWRVANDAGRIPGAATTLVLSDGVVLHHCYRQEAPASAGKKVAGKKDAAKNAAGKKAGFVAQLTAFAAQDGRVLWTAKGGVGMAGACTQPTDVFVANGLVWCGASTEGRDLHSGEVKKTLELGSVVSVGHHFRCYRSKATECYLIWPKRGAEFIDLTGQDHMRNDWLRGSCFTGVMPANGLLYVPSSQCFCYPGVKLSGFLALAPKEKAESAAKTPELEKGPAFGALAPRPSPLAPGDWPMYRHDALRSGAAGGSVPSALRTLWEVKVAATAAQPVVVGQRLLVAEKDAQRIRCLGAADGRPLWDFTAGGRIDSAPTVYNDLVLFGCRDGSVYCLRAADGQLVWRFHAAPQQRLVMSYGQLESAWPVHGSVLVQDGIVYFAAGRSSFLDGGILLYGLNPQTGEVLHQSRLEGPWPDVTTDHGAPFAMEGARSDLLVSDGKNLYMQRIKFDGRLQRLETPDLTTLGDLDMGGRHLLATGGFLDDSGFDRIFWMHTTRWPGFYYTVQAPKSGQLIVFDDHTTYSLSYFYRRHMLSPAFVPGEEGYLLFADRSDNEPILVGKDGTPAAIQWLPASARSRAKYDIANQSVDKEKGVGFTRAEPAKWQKMVPVRARAMVLVGDRLVLVGPPDLIEPEDPHATLEGRRGAVLQVFSAADGSLVEQQRLTSAPVFDGLSAAHGRLYVATLDGKILCLGGRQ